MTALFRGQTNDSVPRKHRVPAAASRKSEEIAMFPQQMEVTFVQIDAVEEMKLRAWARRNYQPAGRRDASWHPIVLDEMQRKERELNG